MSSVREYSYRPFVLKFYRGILWATFFAELIIIRVNIYEITEGENMWLGVVKLVLASTVPLSIFIRVFFFVRPRVLSSFELYDDHILVNQGKKQKEIHFDQVKKVSVSSFSPRFMGGFSLELKSGQRLSFLSVLKNSHEILEAIIKRTPSLLEEKTFHKYMELSQTVEGSWQRMARKLKNLKMVFVKYLVLPVSVAGGLHHAEFILSDTQNFLFLYAWATLAALVLAGILNHIEERVLVAKAIRKELTTDFENKVGYVVDACYYLIYLGLLFFLVTL